MPPIPIASIGTNPEIAQELRNRLLPDYDITHICLTISTATTELPPICTGDLSTPPSSGLGSNASLPPSDRKAPKAVIFGGSIPPEEAAALAETLRAVAPDVKALHVTRQDILDAGGQGPNPEVISRVLRQKLADLGDLSSDESDA